MRETSVLIIASLMSVCTGFGDPADDLNVATIIFLIDGKLVLLRPRKVQSSLGPPCSRRNPVHRLAKTRSSTICKCSQIGPSSTGRIFPA